MRITLERAEELLELYAKYKKADEALRQIEHLLVCERGFGEIKVDAEGEVYRLILTAAERDLLIELSGRSSDSCLA